MKYQELKIQEHNDQVPVGNIPRSMTIVTRYGGSEGEGGGDECVCGVGEGGGKTGTVHTDIGRRVK